MQHEGARWAGGRRRITIGYLEKSIFSSHGAIEEYFRQENK
jgi:hypothetical protein